jgi:hypothetical protein
MVDYSRKDVILIEDLGMVDGDHKGIYECNICGVHIIKFVANAKKGSCRCQQCSKLKPLSDLPLRLVEDLGMVFINETSTRKTRMCKVECPVCSEPYIASANDVKAGKSTMCKKCANSFSGWTDTEWETRGKKSVHFDGYKVYVIKMTDATTEETFYKIGKTYTTTVGRYARETKEFQYSIEVMYEYVHESGVVISKLERILHKSFRHISYIPNIDFCGKTECYKSIDISQVKEIIEEIEDGY